MPTKLCRDVVKYMIKWLDYYDLSPSSGTNIHWGHPLGGASLTGEPSILCFLAPFMFASARLSNELKNSFNSDERQLGLFRLIEPSNSTSSSDIIATVTSYHFCFSTSPAKHLLRRSQSCTQCLITVHA